MSVTQSAPCIGNYTREVYNAWCGRFGDVTRIPGDSVQALFNDMQLYPSKSQVLEMLQCARQCGRRNSPHYLTFGEFCVFAGELRRNGGGADGNEGNKSLNHHNNRSHNHHHHNHHYTNHQFNRNHQRINNHQQQQQFKKPSNHCDVFLGGSCNPTTWRADIAIPTLSKLGISYYNPQVSTWGPELMAAEHDAKESASVLLFVVDSQTRCVAGMLEVAYLVAKKRCVVLVVHPFVLGQAIIDETLSTQEFLDLTEGQSTLLTLVRNQGITVHSNLTTALQCTVNILRSNDLHFAERKLTDKLIRLREVFENLDSEHTGYLTLSNVSLAYYRLTGTNLRINDLHSIMNLSAQIQPENVRVNFEQFCGIVAEFTANSCGEGEMAVASMETNDDWMNQPLQRQSSGNNNTVPVVENGNSTSDKKYDLYLGGSCIKRTTWRQNIAVPLLKKYGITYYNPSLHNNQSASYCNGNETTTELELKTDIDVIDDCHVILFVITNETRSITSMILAANFIALKKNVVLCVQQLSDENCLIGSDLLSKQAIKDYNRARVYLTDLAKHENIPIYDTVLEAVQNAVSLVNATKQQIR